MKDLKIRSVSNHLCNLLHWLHQAGCEASTTSSNMKHTAMFIAKLNGKHIGVNYVHKSGWIETFTFEGTPNLKVKRKVIQKYSLNDFEQQVTPQYLISIMQDTPYLNPTVYRAC